MDKINIHNSPSILNSHKFLPLFVIQFLNALNDNILKMAVLVMITYQGFKLFGLGAELSVNIVALLFVLPFFLFSVYGGKIGDAYCKARLIKIIKYCEVVIITFAAIGFFTKSLTILVLALFLMGVHSTFFGPIKYSILPQYISDRKLLLLANGYTEFGTFVAVLLGQFLGGWYMGKGSVNMIVLLLCISTFSGLILSYRLQKVLPFGRKEKLSWNIVKNTFELCKTVFASKETRNNIHAISWFWALGVVYTTQLSLFTKHYLGGSSHVFSVLLIIFSISIGIGSIFCSRMSNGQVIKKYVIIGTMGMVVFTLFFLLINHIPHSNCLELAQFSKTYKGITDYILIAIIGFFAGLYSITCYNGLQILSPLGILSQIFAVNNILNAAYMLLISVICTVLLLFINIWWLLFVVLIIANLIFAYLYWLANFTQKN